MIKRRTRAIARLVVLSLFSSAILSIGTPANAAGDAWLTKTEWLWFPPGPHFFISCVEREIDLAEGNYRWQLGDSLEGWAGPARGRDIILAKGRYVWSDCIYRDASPPYDPSYIHDSILERKSTGSQATMFYRWDVFPSGQYKATWGSYLRRI